MFLISHFSVSPLSVRVLFFSVILFYFFICYHILLSYTILLYVFFFSYYFFPPVISFCFVWSFFVCQAICFAFLFTFLSSVFSVSYTLFSAALVFFHFPYCVWNDYFFYHVYYLSLWPYFIRRWFTIYINYSYHCYMRFYFHPSVFTVIYPYIATSVTLISFLAWDILICDAVDDWKVMYKIAKCCFPSTVFCLAVLIFFYTVFTLQLCIDCNMDSVLQKWHTKF